MKKYLSIFLLGILLISGCGAKSEHIAMDSAPSFNYNNMGIAADGAYIESSKDFNSKVEMDYIIEDNYVEDKKEDTSNQTEYSQKLIKNYSFEFETLEYDKSLDVLDKKIFELGGYIQDSRSYGKSSNRSFSATIRIPEKKIYEFLNSVNDIGEIIYRTENSNDITLSYYDTQAQIEALEVQYDRILEILKKAEKLEDIIKLEQRLSDIQYQLNSHKSQIKIYDNLVNYVTIKLTLNEVRQIQIVEEDDFFAQIKKGLSSNLDDIKEGFEDVLIFLIVSIPYIVIIGVFIIVFVLIFKSRKKKKLKKEINKE